MLARRVADADVIIALKDTQRVGKALEKTLRAAEERHHLAARQAAHAHRGECAGAAREGVARRGQLLQSERLPLKIQQVQIVEKVRAAALTAEDEDLVAVLRRGLGWMRGGCQSSDGP